MNKKVVEYFDDTIMPLIRNKYSHILPDMCIMILGSVGLGIDDEWSDMEAVIYLPEPIWKQNGASLQLALNECLSITNQWKQKGSIICVHPLSWLLDGQGEKILKYADSVSWQDISFESLFTIQENIIYYDPQEKLHKVREATVPSKMLKSIWKKALLLEIKNFVEHGFNELKLSLKRNKLSEAQINLGHAIESLLHIGFLVSCQYYPFRTHLRWAFDKLSPPILNLRADFDNLADSTEWNRKLNIIEKIFNVYKEYITESNIFPEIDMKNEELDNELLWAERLCAWDNPNWREFITERKEKATKNGHSSDDFWVWSLWEID